MLPPPLLSMQFGEVNFMRHGKKGNVSIGSPLPPNEDKPIFAILVIGPHLIDQGKSKGRGGSRLNEIIYIKYSEQCLSYEKCPENASCYFIPLLNNSVSVVQTTPKNCDAAYKPRKL